MQFSWLQGRTFSSCNCVKTVAFKEYRSWKDYAKQVKANAKSIRWVLVSRGYDIVSGGTDNHLVLVSFLINHLVEKDADAALGDKGITVNKTQFRWRLEAHFVTSIYWIESPALTARGMKS